jgi:hypothetical protein
LKALDAAIKLYQTYIANQYDKSDVSHAEKGREGLGR